MKKSLLYKFGFSSKEVEIYKTILKYQKITPALIAQYTKIARPTVYNICKQLTIKGFLTEDVGGAVLQFIPMSSEELRSLAKKEKEQFIARTNLIEEIANELSLLNNKIEYSVPKIRFVEEENIEHHLQKRTFIWNESIMNNDKYWWGFQDHSFVEYYSKWIEWYWKQAPEDLQLRLFSNHSAIEDKLRGKYPRREIRPWNESANFTASTWIVGDYIIMIITNQKPFYLVEIHDKIMAHNFRELFKSIWMLTSKTQ